MRTRRVAREAEDGYASSLVPGVKATADAEKLARALAAAAARLEFPGPYEALATEPDLEEATWLAFLLALTGPDAPELQAAVLAARPGWAAAEDPGLDPARGRAVGPYRAWAHRAGSQAAAITGEAAWTPERRFSRTFDRLALPGFGRAARFELLTALGAAGLYPLEAGSLHLGGEDPTTVAAKRALVSGDVLLLERRAAALAAGGRHPARRARPRARGVEPARPRTGGRRAGAACARARARRPRPVTVRSLALTDPAVVAELVALQRAAYRVEADLIGADVIPALTESAAQLASSGETFLGARGRRAPGRALLRRGPRARSTSSGSSCARRPSAGGSPPRCSTPSRRPSPTRSAGRSPPRGQRAGARALRRARLRAGGGARGARRGRGRPGERAPAPRERPT